MALKISYMGTIDTKHAFVHEPDLGTKQQYEGTKGKIDSDNSSAQYFRGVLPRPHPAPPPPRTPAVQCCLVAPALLSQSGVPLSTPTPTPAGAGL